MTRCHSQPPAAACAAGFAPLNFPLSRLSTGRGRYTPLHEARSAEVARVLAAGADVTLAGGIIGETALEHHARHPDILAVLRGAAGRPG